MSDTPHPPPSPRPSRDLKPNIHETFVIADQAVARVTFWTKIQWAAIGTGGLAVAGFIVWALATLGGLSTAQAQTKATADSAIESAKTATARVEAVDAGARVAVENLRREMSEDRANTDRKLTDMAITLQQVLREVRKK